MADVDDPRIEEASVGEGGHPRRRIGLVIAIAFGLGMVALIAILATRPPALDRQGKSPLLGKPAPDIVGTTVTSTDGAEFKLSDRRGRFVLVNFFATWCAPCQQEHPELVSFSRRHLQAGDAEVVSVVFSDDDNDVKKFFEDNGGEWTVVSDPEGRTALDYGVTGIPESFLIDPNGFVVSKITGGVTSDGLDAIITAAEQAESQSAGGG
jgi:cytochrome c biogenesis protein CcmG, thiol:disulfide interchange protein DsbE